MKSTEIGLQREIWCFKLHPSDMFSICQYCLLCTVFYCGCAESVENDCDHFHPTCLAFSSDCIHHFALNFLSRLRCMVMVSIAIVLMWFVWSGETLKLFVPPNKVNNPPSNQSKPIHCIDLECRITIEPTYIHKTTG